LDPSRIVLYTQIIVQIVLLMFIVILILRERRRRVSPEAIDALRAAIEDARHLSDEFVRQVQEKADFITCLMQDLEKRIRDADEAVQQLRPSADRGDHQPRHYSKAEVMNLYREGSKPENIARLTGIPLGEIQLMIKLNAPDEGGSGCR